MNCAHKNCHAIKGKRDTQLEWKIFPSILFNVNVHELIYFWFHLLFFFCQFFFSYFLLSGCTNVTKTNSLDDESWIVALVTLNMNTAKAKSNQSGFCIAKVLSFLLLLFTKIIKFLFLFLQISLRHGKMKKMKKLHLKGNESS